MRLIRVECGNKFGAAVTIHEWRIAANSQSACCPIYKQHDRDEILKGYVICEHPIKVSELTSLHSRLIAFFEMTY